uniref:vWA domain-containing protein n=1 Tax=Castellaniella defragrans TaxID=75697 RepID=UPI00333E2769
MSPRLRLALSDPRWWLLVAAFVTTCAAWAGLGWTASARRADVLLVVDVTGSMNVRDYEVDHHPVSRLDFAKLAMSRFLRELPCGSRLGLAIFTERRAFLLFEPMEVCENYDPILGALSALDWRMAWEGDSQIANGLYSALELADDLRVNLVFLTDGQEAPPLPAAGRRPFGGTAGTVAGLILGVGGDRPVPIPKFDEDGREVGVFGPNDVDQENRSGPPPAAASQREGWHPRNAPFGGKAATGQEHLSSVRETYLRALAKDVGLHYARLALPDGIRQPFMAHAHLREEPERTSLALPLAALAWLLMVIAHLWPQGRLRNIYDRPQTSSMDIAKKGDEP